jgi:hypothetical protein
MIVPYGLTIAPYGLNCPGTFFFCDADDRYRPATATGEPLKKKPRTWRGFNVMGDQEVNLTPLVRPLKTKPCRRGRGFDYIGNPAYELPCSTSIFKILS